MCRIAGPSCVCSLACIPYILLQTSTNIPCILQCRFTAKVDEYNAYQQGLAKRLEFVSYVDCGNPFVSSDGGKVIEDLMPDALHPNDKGMALVAECLSRALDRILNGTA